MQVRFPASPSLSDETLSRCPVFWDALKPEPLPVEPSGVPAHRTTKSINPPGQNWYSQGTRPQKQCFYHKKVQRLVIKWSISKLFSDPKKSEKNDASMFFHANQTLEYKADTFVFWPTPLKNVLHKTIEASIMKIEQSLRINIFTLSYSYNALRLCTEIQ